MPVAGNLYYYFHHATDSISPPLVLIHGAGGMHLYWPPELRRLAGYNIYAIDLPGHGKSDICDGQQTIGDNAAYLVRWLDAVHLPRVILVGHSMGSAIALAIALRHPERVVGLALIGAGARLRVHPELLKCVADTTTFYKATDFLLAHSFYDQGSAHLLELAKKRLEDIRQSVLYGDLMACDRFDVMGQLGAVQQDTLVICGAEDEMTPVRYAQYLASSIPHAHLNIIPRAGHMVMLEQPRVVAESMLSFLQGISFQPGEGT